MINILIFYQKHFQNKGFAFLEREILLISEALCVFDKEQENMLNLFDFIVVYSNK
jgi:hypothetical protein